MKGYFDERELTHYLNLCHLIQQEMAKSYPPELANVHAALAIAKSEPVGIARLLIDKGLITKEEYSLALTDGLQVTLEALQHTSPRARKSWFARIFGG